MFQQIAFYWGFMLKKVFCSLENIRNRAILTNSEYTQLWRVFYQKMKNVTIFNK